MSPETVTMTRADLAALACEMAKQITDVVQHQLALPELYAFPEDIVKITKGKVPTNTLIYWRQQGLFKTIKLGKHLFVRPDDWQYFVDNHRILFGKAKKSKREARA
ncbi:MAG: hypothetical protein WCZ86_03870 [Desulfurivibrionaceae bacterium]|jgi:hypothetical protein